MEGVEGIATFHGNNPLDAAQSVGGLFTSGELQIRWAGRPPFEINFILRPI
jgi:hypothetical protein